MIGVGSITMGSSPPSGAARVDAVEIDPVIADGRYHPHIARCIIWSWMMPGLMSAPLK